MTVGTYAALGWRWSRVGGSALAHLVPPRPGPLARSACGRVPLHDLLLETPDGLLSELEKCGACQRRDGTAGPARNGRVAGFGQ